MDESQALKCFSALAKVYPDAKAALAGVLQGRHDDHVRRLRPVRHPEAADRGDPRDRA
jgi:hypothetical protein